MKELANTTDPLTLIRASSDEAAIALYLSQKDDQGYSRFSNRTLESYRRDIKRLMVFLDCKSLNSLTLEDVHAFIEWLKTPPPYLIDEKHRRPINHPEWRPFYKKGLSPSGVRQQLASIKAFYRWLGDTGYNSRNPFGLLKSAKREKSSDSPKRQLYKEDIKAVSNYLANGSESTHPKTLRRIARQRWLWFGYLLSGLRISELISHSTGHIYSEITNGDKVWMIAVTGKGRRQPEKHPLPDRFVKELWAYRKSLGLDPWPVIPQPLVLSLSGKIGLVSRSSAHNEFKRLIQAVAEHQEKFGNHDSAARLSISSTHWLRHSFVTCLLDVTSDIPAVSGLARHRDIKTTMGYDHSELVALKSILNKFATLVSD